MLLLAVLGQTVTFKCLSLSYKIPLPMLHSSYSQRMRSTISLNFHFSHSPSLYLLIKTKLLFKPQCPVSIWRRATSRFLSDSCSRSAFFILGHTSCNLVPLVSFVHSSCHSSLSSLLTRFLNCLFRDPCQFFAFLQHFCSLVRHVVSCCPSMPWDPGYFSVYSHLCRFCH